MMTYPSHHDHERADMRLRVILIAYHYPPDPAVGSLRARNVAQSLAAAGHEVFVVSVARQGVSGDSEDGAVRVIRVQPGLAPRDLLKKLKRLISRRKQADAPTTTSGVKQPPTSGVSWKSPEQVSTIKRWIEAISWLPDDLQGFILPAATAAIGLMRGDGRDLLYTTAPPFSAHIAGLIARCRRRFRWIVEYRDPWTDNVHKPWFVRAKLTDAFERWVERRCLAMSDGVVPVASKFAELLVRRHGPKVAKKMLVVRNGIPSLTHRPSDPSRWRVVYAGSFYIRRDPRPFFAALATIRAERGVARPIDVQLIGDCRYYEGEPLEPEIERLGLTDAISFVDWLPHDQSMEMMASADLLLLLAKDQPLSIPNKAYEYLGTGRPILAVVDRDGETAHLLRDIGGHFVLSDGDAPDAMERALSEVLAAPLVTAVEPSPALAALTTKNQMKILADWIDGNAHSEWRAGNELR
jgi:hypothetical protein